MNFIKEKISGITKRILCATYGIYYFRNASFRIPHRLKIAGKYQIFKFVDTANPQFVFEFSEICLNDCYHLKTLREKIPARVIVDVGSNQGIFAIAARQQFPKAKLFCYEPNLQLKPILSDNLKKLKGQVYYEAVTKNDCRVSLEFGETDLLTKTFHSDEGMVTGTALHNVVQRAGGQVDILKLDCEGAEWELLEDEDSWKNIMAVTMEYHLWAKKGSTFKEIEDRLASLGFKMLFHEKHSDSFGILTAIRSLNEKH